MAEYNQDVAAEEQYYQDWLIANEDLKGSEVYKEAEDGKEIILEDNEIIYIVIIWHTAVVK